MIIEPSNCAHGNVRFVGGQSINEGELQVCYNGLWTFLCSRSWLDSDTSTLLSNVACQQLRFLRSKCKGKLLHNLSFNFIGNSYSLASFFGNDSTPVITNQFHCNGNENSLSQCTSNSNSNECHSFQTYGIYCAGK